MLYNYKKIYYIYNNNCTNLKRDIRNIDNYINVNGSNNNLRYNKSTELKMRCFY